MNDSSSPNPSTRTFRLASYWVMGLLVVGCIAFGFWHAAHTKPLPGPTYPAASPPDEAYYAASSMATTTGGKIIGVKRGASIYEAIATVKLNPGAAPLSVLTDLCGRNAYTIDTKSESASEIRWSGHASGYGCKVTLRYDKAKKMIECRFVDITSQP